MAASSGSTDDKGSGLWGQLPSFDPTEDDYREYAQKVKFLHAVFPEKDKSLLAPRLAMLCKGTAWSQVKMIEAGKLTDKAEGVNVLLSALSNWEESSELKTFELFEKCLYKVIQKPDETAHSYAMRLQAAFNDLGDQVTVKQMQAFVLLRQSATNNEDKKRVLAMTDGQLAVNRVEQAMRTLSTKVLLSGQDVKKKVYPTNYIEDPNPHPDPSNEDENYQSTYNVSNVPGSHR